jgi:hypothetical protein
VEGSSSTTAAELELRHKEEKNIHVKSAALSKDVQLSEIVERHRLAAVESLRTAHLTVNEMMQSKNSHVHEDYSVDGEIDMLLVHAKISQVKNRSKNVFFFFLFFPFLNLL